MTKVTKFNPEGKPHKKSEICFVNYLSAENSSCSKAEAMPINFDNIILLVKGLEGELDIMMAWNDTESEQRSIYLGHFNDGIV